MTDQDDPAAGAKTTPNRVIAIEGKTPVTVRLAIPGDEGPVADLYVAGQKLAYGSMPAAEPYLAALDLDAETELWLEQIKDPNHHLYVAESQEGLIGFANGGFGQDNLGVLSDTWVNPDWHHTGVAQTLAGSVVEDLLRLGANPLHAMVHSHNKAGEGFCEKLGAEYKGYLPNALWFHGTGDLPDLYGPFAIWEWADINQFPIPPPTS